MNLKFLLIFLFSFPLIIYAEDYNSDTTQVMLDSLKYTAEKIIYNLDREEIELINNSAIFYKNSYIKSDSIIINLKNKTALSSGSAEMFDGNQKIYGNTVFFDIETQEGLLTDGFTHFENGFYLGSQMRKIGEKTFDIDQAKFTTCDIGKHYYIYSPKFRVFLNDKIVAKPVILYVNHFPILVLPFATFPIIRERKTGFLIPEPGFSNTEGKYLKNFAYFYTFGKYGDMLISLDLMELTGFEARLKGRYKKRYYINGNVNCRLLYNYHETYDNYRLRWSFNSFHKQNIPPYKNLLLKTDFVSDAEVFKTSSDKEIRMDQELHSYVYYSSVKKPINFNTSFDYKKDLTDKDENYLHVLNYTRKAEYYMFKIYEYSQLSLHPDQTNNIMLKLPQINFRIYRLSLSDIFRKKSNKSDILNKIYFSYNSYFLHEGNIKSDHPSWQQLLYKDTYDSTGEYISEHREGIKHSLSISFNDKIFKKRFRFVQNFNYDEIWEDKDKNNSKLARGFYYSSNSSISSDIYGLFTINTGFIKALRHIITPSITYSMHPDFSENERLYSFSPISISSASRSEKISLVLANKLQAKLLIDNKIRKINNLLSLNSSLNYDFEKKPRGFSDISHTLTIMPFNFEIFKTKFKFSNSFRCSQDFYSLDIYNYTLSANLSLKSKFNYIDYFPIKEKSFAFTEDNNYLASSQVKKEKSWDLSFSYSYTKNERSNTFSSGLHSNLNFYLTKNWRFRYSNYYNFKEKELISQSLNIYRDLHCWQLNFKWNKSGEYWSYSLEIKAKKLPDLKFEHKDRKHQYY